MSKTKQRSLRIVLDDGEDLDYGNYSNDEIEDTRSGREKMSDFAQSRERDHQGRFVNIKQRELDEFYYEEYKIVYKPARNGPDHILTRQIELHWYQKIYVWFGIGILFAGGQSIFIALYEGVKWLTRVL